MKDSRVIPGRDNNDNLGSTSSGLLERVQHRTPGAWEQLTTLYGPWVYSWARRLGLRAEDSADIVQDVFLAVSRSLAGFQHGPNDSFRGWLWTITQNKVRDLARRKQDRPQATGGTDAYDRLLHTAEPPESSSEPGLTPSSLLMHQALDLIRPEFEEPSWRAFWKVVVENQRPADVAAELGLSVNAVYIARSRILRRLRDELGDPPTPDSSG